MKLVGVMSLAHVRKSVRSVFERHDVHIYSEIDITGHTQETIRQYGWWVAEGDGVPLYSTLFFAVLPADKAEEIMDDVAAGHDEWDAEHPPRAFLIDVEKMV